MKKILLILSVACFLTGCGKKETVSTSVEETVAENKVVESTSESVPEDTPEADTKEHTHEDVAIDNFEANEKEESVVGLTFQEAEEKGVFCSNYMGFNGEYIFYAKSEDGLVKYEITSVEAADVLSKLGESWEYLENWNNEISNCKIDTTKVTILDKNLIDSLVGKTVGEIIDDGFEQVGYIGYGVNGLILRKDNLDIVVYLDDSCKEISENTDFENIDHHKYYEVYIDCYVTEAVYW